jgi:hypothetical protein
MDKILWHRWETRRETEKTNFILVTMGVLSLLEPVIVLPKRGGEVEGNNLVIKLSCQKRG